MWILFNKNLNTNTLVFKLKIHIVKHIRLLVVQWNKQALCKHRKKFEIYINQAKKFSANDAINFYIQMESRMEPKL